MQQQHLKTYEWRIVQSGRIIIKPDGNIPPFKEHRPTSTIIWPACCHPGSENTILTDPYFSNRSFPEVVSTLQGFGLSMADIGWIYITHPHGDHMLHLPAGHQPGSYPVYQPNVSPHFSDIARVHLPGHHPELSALVFRSTRHQMTWVVGDAILDDEWLRAWGYYFPNGYDKDEIIQTWMSVSVIIGHADVIIPGHGSPIFVTEELVSGLLSTFMQAKFAQETKDVYRRLSRRLENMKSGGEPPHREYHTT